MLGLALLLAATATVTVSSSATTDCPSPEQLGHALAALTPGLIGPATTPPAAPGAAPTPASLRLAVTSSPEGDVRVDLLDPQGETLLHRVLPAPPRGRTPDCPALADTVALIVDRYLHDVGYEAPPLPPPPKPAPPPPPTEAAQPTTITSPAPGVREPPGAPAGPGVTWRLGLVASGRLGDAGGADGDGGLAIGVESGGPGMRLGARLSAGIAPTAEARWVRQRASQTASLRRLPFRVGGYFVVPAGPGQLEPGLGVGVDLLLVSSAGGEVAAERHTAPFGDASLAYAISLMRPVYLRVLSRAALAVPYDFKTLAGTQVWGTPRGYGELSVELGLAFP